MSTKTQEIDTGLKLADLPQSLHSAAKQIIELIPDNCKWLIPDYYIHETAFGYIISVTKVHRVKHSPDGGWEILNYDCPRIHAEQMRAILSTGKVRWFEYGSWQDGRCINIALERK